MTEYTVSISENDVWAGSGPRDSYGHIETSAVLSAAPDDEQHRIYEAIEEAVTEAIESEKPRAQIEANGYRYTMMIEAIERCECGQVTGEPCQWTGPIAETVIVEYMPEYLRSSHLAAGDNSGSYPHNGAQRIRVEQSCADRLTHVWIDGDQTDQLDEWVRIVR